MRNSYKLASLILVLVIALGGIAYAQDGETVNILYWQAVSTMNPYLSGGTKDLHASSVVLEPLARFDETGAIVPWLAVDVPTVENGGVAEDLTSITWQLQEGLLWSDGTPVTSADVVFTWQYCTDEAMGCNSITSFNDVVDVVAVDDLTVQISFSKPKPYPYAAFVGSTGPVLQAAQFADCLGENAQSCTDQNFYPIGTGAFMVEEFRANDVVTFVPNPNYRGEQPFFDRVVLKGGGDAESAARAVLETGEADYAWNLQIAPAILNDMEAAGNGTVVVALSTGVERLMINQTNPDPALGDMRAVYMEDGSNAHPFLTIPAVYKALSMAIDRNIIAEQLYGAGGVATCNVLAAPLIYASHNNDDCLVQDIAGANALLDEAGIVDTDDDGVRETPDGVPLVILYQTSTNPVRQSTQALVKQWWSEIGVETELRNIDAGVFFGGDPASPDTYGKFYADVEMYTNTFDGTDPENYMSNWACSEISGPDNQWLGNNIPRWCNPEYDALVVQMAETANIDARIALAMQMNDMLMQSGAMIPLVHRGSVSAYSNTLEGVRMNAWDSELWNIADWSRAE
jgi:peptide/nickel transport system substrate-binding protein